MKTQAILHSLKLTGIFSILTLLLVWASTSTSSADTLMPNNGDTTMDAISARSTVIYRPIYVPIYERRHRQYRHYYHHHHHHYQLPQHECDHWQTNKRNRMRYSIGIHF